MNDSADEFAQIAYQVMWTRLTAVVEEQAKSLIRTAFSATVSEAGDLAAGVFDTQGRMLAQAVTGTPGHVNSMAIAVRHFLDKFPAEEMREGDHFLTNDPWLSSGHLHDITVVSPTFQRGRIVALFACCCHQVDIGGLGQGPDATSVFEEGLYLPIMRLARDGVVNQELMALIGANVRRPLEVEGDILSYMASNGSGGRHLGGLLDEFSDIELADLAEFIFERSRKAVIDRVSALPNGVWRNDMTVDGYDEPVTLSASLTIEDERIIVDYGGSSPASKFGINLVLNYTMAYSAYGVRAAVAPDIPNNAGSLEPISVSAPEGSILNVQKPGPVCARHIIGQFLPDVVLGCLEKVPGFAVPAEGSAGIWGIQMRGGEEVSGSRDPASNQLRPAAYDLLFFNSGGTGARPASDGLSATGFPSGVRALPVEAIENNAPVVVWRKDLRASSGGAGKWRGGLGQTVEVGSRDDSPFAVFAMFDRVDNPARGREGGAPGAAGTVGTRAGEDLRPKGKQVITAGDHLIIEVPGGGGFGPALERDAALVAADVAANYLDPASALAEYGVVVDASGEFDEATTLAERNRRMSVT